MADPKQQKGARELAFAHHPDSLAEPGAQEKMVDGVADGILDMVDEERKRQGLPPLEE